MILLLKALFGALLVVAIDLLSRTKYYHISGLLPLFPTFALIAHFIVYFEKGADAVKHTALFGIWSIIPYAVYLIVVFGLVGSIGFYRSIIIGIVTWTISAGVLILLWQR